MSEKDEALLVAGALQIRFSEYEGNKLLDVRKYYKDKKTKEYKPTRKGISLSRLQFEAINNAFNSRYEDIEDWLSTPAHDKSIELNALDENIHSTEDITVKFSSWRGLEPFNFVCDGADNTLHMNISNAWVENLFNELSEGQSSSSNLATLGLIIGFFQSTNLLDTRNEVVKEFLDTIIGNWGICSRKVNLEGIKVAR